MGQAQQAAAAPPNPFARIHPFLVIGCGVVMILCGGMLDWLEPGLLAGKGSDSPVASVPAAQPLSASKIAEREAKARAEQQQLEAQQAAIEAERRALLVDGATEAKAKSEREEMASRQAAVAKAHKATLESEEAWNRFYKPSENCRDPSAATTIECVNAYIKAKREFASRAATAGGAAPR